MILPLEIKQFESIDTQNFLAREARRNFVTSLGPKAPKNLPNLVKSHENFVWDKNLSKYKGGSSKGGVLGFYPLIYGMLTVTVKL